ncbi:hypothetical protein JRQ81_000254 [Phrynocephalus forsythii]|uniref:Uncharacterized protein n=1 Tax=Phrynocephalus forsythii TaxID=171643 RepID=A0A9Q0Y7P7_9SAUR|nr:hypothetical protein JRQ81_000254 [Phrynocephalus forsythii]
MAPAYQTAQPYGRPPLGHVAPHNCDIGGGTSRSKTCAHSEAEAMRYAMRRDTPINASGSALFENRTGTREIYA